MSRKDGEPIRGRIFDTMFGSAGKGAKRFDAILFALILASVAAVMLNTALDHLPLWAAGLRAVEVGLTLLFTAEYLIRLWCHPRPWQYARSPLGIVDFLGIMPTYLAFLVPGWEAAAALRLLRVLRIFRIFGLGRFARSADVVGSALGAARFKIAIFATVVMLVVLTAGTLMHALEGPENGFTSIPTASYWAIATLTST